MTYFAGAGTVVKRGQASGSSLPAPGSDVFDVMNLLGNLKLPDDIRTVNSFKTLDSPDPRKVGGGFEDRIISFRIVFDPTDAVHISMKQVDAKTASSTTARRNYKVILPDTGQYTFDCVGFISKWTWETIENEKEAAATVEISVDGTVTETA